VDQGGEEDTTPPPKSSQKRKKDSDDDLFSYRDVYSKSIASADWFAVGAIMFTGSMFIVVTGQNLDIALTLIIASLTVMIWTIAIFAGGLFKWRDKNSLKTFFLIMNVMLLALLAFNVGTVVWLAVRYKSQ
jgi:VIT1/CCC1 family predicted Fe2+/Mn2+ transporter